jgi:hypothetical protein
MERRGHWFVARAAGRFVALGLPRRVLPQQQRSVLGQWLAGQATDVLDLLVEAIFARALNERGRMVGEWLKSRGGALQAPSLS